ncbi:hypothetical protein AMTRI_Chr03g139140 [Amborella trichopoda]|uniref:lysine-specific demethylase JMJ30 n=1 Tax=Amborella trichopoda TaxID=13333 RepID=UPI0009BE1106|nr:lysine-specific demethylase JMJ30 [Amborella trichopoda]|eukprot:XP_020526473.1 lysine-specific demethylase JMJ30 [Amborella trichopoda]
METQHHRLPMPTVELEREKLLERVFQEGGFAYVNLAVRAASGEAQAAEAAREIAWEQLHSGPWHSVRHVWRDAYAMSCLHVAEIHWSMGEVREALRALDMGIIMGGALLRKDLDAAVKALVGDRFGFEGSSGEQEGLEGGLGGGAVACAGSRSRAEEVLQLLPSKSLSCKKIDKRSDLSLEGFLCNYFLPGSPVIISGAISHWPAMKRWKSMEYLKRIAGDRTVPVEVGKNYLAPGWKQELISFSEFLDRIYSSDNGPNGLTYLAQHPVFDQILPLRQDIDVPDYCAASVGELKSLNAWFGPSGTVTPLHHDPHHNLFAQVVGRKYVRLYPSSISNDLYPYEESMLHNSSRVDLDNPDPDEFPLAQDLDFMDCILEEGEMLYIPPKWWHYVRSLTTSFSVSFWWSDCNLDYE